MDNLKAQTHQALDKLIEATHHQQKQDQQNNLDNPEGVHAIVTCRELIDLYSHSLQPKQKFLIEVSLNDQLANQMTTIEFKEKLSKLQSQINMEQNQFKTVNHQVKQQIASKPPTRGHRAYTNVKKSQPTVESHPQYFRINQEVSHKLYLAYKGLSLGPSTKPGLFSFQEKQQQRSSMNYQKIVQIFKDADIKLQINQKLMITRAIKKFCFNQNFINQEQFTKLFKVIVHGMGYREQVFDGLLKKKATQIQKASDNNKTKNNGSKHRKNYRFKTDASNSIKKLNPFHEKRNTEQSDLSMFQSVKAKDFKSTIENQKGQKGIRRVVGAQSCQNTGSYLVKAMEGQKIAKITWQSLFNMKQGSMHHNIVIPDIVKNLKFDEI